MDIRTPLEQRLLQRVQHLEAQLEAANDPSTRALQAVVDQTEKNVVLATLDGLSEYIDKRDSYFLAIHHLSCLLREISGAVMNGDPRKLRNYLPGKDEAVLVLSWRIERARQGLEYTEAPEILQHAGDVAKTIAEYADGDPDALEHLRVLATGSEAITERIVSQLKQGIDFGGRGFDPGNTYIREHLPEYYRCHKRYWEAGLEMCRDIDRKPRAARSQAEQAALENCINFVIHNSRNVLVVPKDQRRPFARHLGKILDRK